ncbi:MAG: hypothetical protein AB8B83_06710 [Bdellovibrionales bacterium]
MNKNFLPVLLLTMNFNAVGLEASAQNHQNFSDSELTRIGPDDGCLDTVGELIDRYADESGQPRILMRNYALTILGQVAEDVSPGSDVLETMLMPSLNEQLETLPPHVASVLTSLFRNPLIATKFRDGCDLAL